MRAAVTQRDVCDPYCLAMDISGVYVTIRRHCELPWSNTTLLLSVLGPSPSSIQAQVLPRYVYLHDSVAGEGFNKIRLEREDWLDGPVYSVVHAFLHSADSWMLCFAPAVQCAVARRTGLATGFHPTHVQLQTEIGAVKEECKDLGWKRMSLFL